MSRSSVPAAQRPPRAEGRPHSFSTWAMSRKLHPCARHDAPVETVPAPKPRKAKRQFAQIDLAWLGTPAGRKGIASYLRLYLLLQFLTKRGTRSWKLTNERRPESGSSPNKLIAEHTDWRFLDELKRELKA
jgi:hypothetical protein